MSLFPPRIDTSYILRQHVSSNIKSIEHQISFSVNSGVPSPDDHRWEQTAVYCPTRHKMRLWESRFDTTSQSVFKSWTPDLKSHIHPVQTAHYMQIKNRRQHENTFINMAIMTTCFKLITSLDCMVYKRHGYVF